MSISEWKFEIGPCKPMDACDHLVMARFILQRVAEDFDCVINFDYDPNQISKIYISKK